MAYSAPYSYPYPGQFNNVKDGEDYCKRLYAALQDRDARQDYVRDRSTDKDLKDLIVRPEWYGAKADGVADDTTALQAAITAAVAAKIPVALSGSYLFTSTLSLPAYTTIIGTNTAGNATAGYGAALTFKPSSATAALDVSFTASYIQSVELRNFQLVGDPANAYPTIGISYEGVLGGVIDGVGISGPFSTAGLLLDGLLDCQIDKVNIGNANTTGAMAAGILVKGTPWISTTAKIKDVYIHGVTGATGGITDGIVLEGDAAIGFVIDRPIVESVAQYAYNIHKGNYVDIYSPWIENCPNIDAALPLFRIGKDTLGATYVTRVNIYGGRCGGPNAGSTDTFCLDVGSIERVNITGVAFDGPKKFMDATSSSTAKISIHNCYCGNTTSYGTIGNTSMTMFDSTNRFSTMPGEHNNAGTYAKVPIYYMPIGHSYFATDKLTNGSPLWWNGTDWVDVFSDADGDSQGSSKYWRGDKSWQTLNQSAVESNLATNGDFTSDTTSWVASAGFSSLASVAGGQSGNCLELTRVSSTTQYAHQNITTIVGKTYRLTAYVKSGTSGNETCAIGFGALNFASVLEDTTSTSSGSWVQMSAVWTADRTNPCVYVEKGSATAGTMLFDTVWVGEIFNTIDQDLSTTASPTFVSPVVTTLKVGANQVVGAQALTQAALKADYTTADLDTEAEIIAAINATNAGFNTLLAKLKTHGLLAS